MITCITLLIAGCGVLGQEGSHWPEWDEHNRPPPELLEMTLVEVPDTVEQGQAVEFTMEVTNTSGKDYILFYGCPGHDFFLTGEENTLFWRFFNPNKTEVIDGEEIKTACVSALFSVSLKAGESLELKREWDGRDYLHEKTLMPGRYEVTGWYKVAEIVDEQQSWEEEREVVILDNTGVNGGMGHFTTEPVEFVVVVEEE